jgi:repressor LexA
MSELTERQREILTWIKQEIEIERVPPTVREIADRFQMSSPNGAMSHLRALERKGYLTWRKKCARALRLVEAGNVT